MKLIAMIEIEIDDIPGLDKITDAWGTPAGVHRMRQTVVTHLEQPGGVSRMVAVMPVEIAQSMMKLYEAMQRESERGEETIFQRPPPSFVPPVRG